MTDLAAQIRALGRAQTPEMLDGTRALFTALHPAEPAEGLAVTRDIAYGEHERQRLDLFLPRNAGQPLAPIVYLHGGSYVRGAKRTEGSPFYDNVGRWAVDGGFAGITANYRLAPEHTWPSGAIDLERIVDWIASAGPDHGLDPGRVVLMGQSSGAGHVACYIAGHGGVQPRAAAAIMLSGTYHPALYRERFGHVAYFGDDHALDDEQSALDGLIASEIPQLFGVAELDPESFPAHLRLLAERWFEHRDELPPIVTAIGHNHVSQVQHLGTDDRAYGDALLRFARLATRDPDEPARPASTAASTTR